jgi:ABC-type oligopeptide transport system substrate-binding subunit
MWKLPASSGTKLEHQKMKTLIAIIASIGLLSGAAFAGCGKKINTAGTLVKFDKGTKSLTMNPVTKDKKGLTITSKTKITDKDGKKVKIADLVGQKGIVVISEHGKVDSVGFKAAKKEDDKKKG